MSAPTTSAWPWTSARSRCRGAARGAHGLARRPAPFAAQDAGQVSEGLDARDVDAVHELCLGHAVERHDEPLEPGPPGALGHGERAAARADLAVEGELAEDRKALQRLGGDVARGGQDRAGDREVEAGPRLAQRRGREVDGDAAQREVEPGVEDGRAHALARLAYGAVGEPDDREAGQAGAHVDLHGDAPRLEAVDGEGDHAGEHGRRR